MLQAPGGEHHVMIGTNEQIQLARMMKGDEAMRALEDAKHRKAGPMELGEKVDEVRKQIPHAFSITLQDRVATNMDQNIWYDQKVLCVQCICIEHIELFGHTKYFGPYLLQLCLRTK